MRTFLPTSPDELAVRSWPDVEVLFITPDPYIDHASFGVPLLGRYLEARGFRTGILSEPEWRDPESFLALGRPGLWCGITGGAVDSVLANYTVNRKRRREDAYGPGGAPAKRPTRATIVYANAARKAFPGLPLVLGGVEASTRRFAHFDWWDGAIRRSCLLDARCDLVVWGEGELVALHVSELLRRGERRLWGIPGTAVVVGKHELKEVLSEAARYVRIAREPFTGPAADLAPMPETSRAVVVLPSYEELRAGPPELLIELSLTVERETRGPVGAVLVQPHGDRLVVSFPRARFLTGRELDAVSELPFTRTQHPASAPAPALETIQTSVITHRGCPGGCTFCAISLHHGQTIRSRSAASVVREVTRIARAPFFRGTISDLGGPTANLYGMDCREAAIEAACRRPSCLWPSICPNFRITADPFRGLLRAVREIPAVGHAFVASGVRHDVLLRTPELLPDLVRHHTGGRLKIAPEHGVDRILRLMRKPPVRVFEEAVRTFRASCRREGRRYQLIPYMIASFPGATDRDMWAVKELLARLRLRVDQVQDFWPTPSTVAAALYWAERDASGRPLYVAKSYDQRRRQQACVRSHDPRHRRALEALQRELGCDR
jgi:uncharacterized radical SAM protein YgiQ